MQSVVIVFYDIYDVLKEIISCPSSKITSAEREMTDSFSPKKNQPALHTCTISSVNERQVHGTLLKRHEIPPIPPGHIKGRKSIEEVF